MVIWANYLQNVADFMGTTVTEAGILSSLIFTSVALLAVLIATRKNRNSLDSVPIVAFFSILLFTYMQWFPTWTGSVIALILVIYLGVKFAGLPGGN